MRRFFVAAVAISATALATSDTASLKAQPRSGTDDQAITHLLNRTGWGPRPGDVDAVRAMGIARYLDQQLHPERIPDAAMPGRLAGLATVGLSSRQILDNYERPQIEARRQRKADAQAVEPGSADQKPPDPVQRKANSIVVELSEQKLLRAVYSERQLQEVLADFWFNHFNVDARKGRDRFMLTEYERDTIRPRVLGSFRDLLGATAKSPAMLFYLDNWMSADPQTGLGARTRRDLARTGFGPQARRELVPGLPERFAPRLQPERKNAPKGLNENYGRELMELHTLGVDGGYTQKDVTEVARAFTGWTIENPRQGAGFKFDPRIHDNGQKVVLGHVIKAGGGESDGEQVLDILAAHPSTARFIATKLVRRFVSDAPPPALVDRAAARFRQTRGDLREVTRTILTSPEFLLPDAYRAKVKTPLEFLVSALRAAGADVHDAQPLVRELQQEGMPLYMCQPPTGYKDTSDAWVNTGALVSRMNFALRLASNQLPRTMVGDLTTLNGSIFDDAVSDTTRSTIARATSIQQTAALTLGAPEFQRR
jgi:uncharacterized protein (DUF1800 family)